MRNPRDFFKPLAIGAPDPPHEVPFKPSRMIHFLDASNEKMRAKVPDMVREVDILLGNLEDAIPIDRKVAAREGLIEVAKETDFGDTQLWKETPALEHDRDARGANPLGPAFREVLVAEHDLA